MPFNQIVKSYIDLYSTRRRKLVGNMLGLSTYYFPIFEQELEKAGLPLELKYLPIIESALKPEATSKAGAAGLWQFMIGTGKLMGMEINSLVDERRDPLVSSQKAARYLKEMYDIYQDWNLAIAAYNCGPGNVNRALRRANGKTDYWEIYNYLPKETRGYLPAFIAANYIMNYYTEHNICPVTMTSLPLTTDTIRVDEQIHFQQIAEVLQMPIDQIKSLNPQYRRDIIPKDTRSRTLRLPTQYICDFIQSKDTILYHKSELFARRNTVEPAGFVSSNSAGNTPYTIHKIRSGETLSTIARKYGVSQKNIKKWNHLKHNTLQKGKRLRIYNNQEVMLAKTTTTNGKQNITTENKVDSTSLANTESLQESKKNTGATTSNPEKSLTYHRVKSGETLSAIAQRYNVSQANIKRWNNMKSNNLQSGKRLLIYNVNMANVPARKQNTTNLQATTLREDTIANSGNEQNTNISEKTNKNKTQKEYKYYTVSKGESLWSISKRFPGVSFDQIKEINNLQKNALKIGQVLKIPTV